MFLIRNRFSNFVKNRGSRRAVGWVGSCQFHVLCQKLSMRWPTVSGEGIASITTMIGCNAQEDGKMDLICSVDLG